MFRTSLFSFKSKVLQTQSIKKALPQSSCYLLTFVALGVLGAIGFGTYYYYATKNKRVLDIQPLTDSSVIFVLGGPGAGKGTQCTKLAQEFGYVHLSAGDLLRAERNRPESPYGDLINTYIADGQIVPMEITIALLHQAMVSNAGRKKFLIDGFPRQMDQAMKFESAVCKSKLVLFLDCPEEEMLKRLIQRGKTSGRVDDNLESIKKRFQTFRKTSYLVVEHYEKIGKVARVFRINQVTCNESIEAVYNKTRKVVVEAFDN